MTCQAYKIDKWREDLWDVSKKADLEAVIEACVGKLFDGDDEETTNERLLTKNILNEVLKYDIKDRKAPKQILENEFFKYFAKKDDELWERELKNAENDVKKEEEDEKKEDDW